MLARGRITVPAESMGAQPTAVEPPALRIPDSYLAGDYPNVATTKARS